MSERKALKTISAQLHDDFWESYCARTDLIASIREEEDFYKGEQWPAHEPDGMPRPVMNVVKHAVNLVASKIVGTPIYLSMSASDGKTDCSKLRQFDEYVCSSVGMGGHYYRSAVNGENFGTEVAYLRWDKDDETVQGFYKGGLAVEHIDLREFAVSNPRLNDVQKQKWVMFWTDVPADAVKAMIGDPANGFSESEVKKRVEALSDDEALRADDVDKDKDILPDVLLRVYTRFFRVGGEVCYMCSTQTADLFAYPRPLSRAVPKTWAKDCYEEWERKVGKAHEEPDRLTRYEDMAIDPEDVRIGDYTERNTPKEHGRVKERFSLYPFAVFSPIPLNNSIFGMSKTHELIPSQKAINFMYAMPMQCAQNNAYNKVFVKDGALRNQVITNEPGQVITDYYQGATWGVRMAESQPIPNDLTSFNSAYLDVLSKFGGFSDVMSGNVSNQDLSGYAVQQMIKQNNTPIEQEQQLFWRFAVDMAKIRVMFYKHYVDEAMYTWDYTDAEVEANESARKAIVQGVNAGLKVRKPDGSLYSSEDLSAIGEKVRKTQVDSLSSKSIWGVDFDIRIDAQQGLADSKLTEEQAWSDLILNGGVSQMDADTLEFVIKGDPAFSPAFKSEVGRYIDTMKRSENQQLRQQLAQAAQYMQSLEAQIGVQTEYVKNLTAEFTDKIGVANKVIKNLQARGSAKPDQGAVKSDSSRGISQAIASSATNQGTNAYL